MMEDLYRFSLIAALAIGAMHLRRQASGRTGLSQEHPRRRRAQIEFPFIAAFGVLAVFTWWAGTDGTAGTVALTGFGIWFVALFLVRKQIPQEAEVRAYEAAHRSASQATNLTRRTPHMARPTVMPRPPSAVTPEQRLPDAHADAAVARAAAAIVTPTAKMAAVNYASKSEEG